MKKAKYLMAAGIMAFSLLSGMPFTKEKVSAADETVKCELTNAEGHRGDTIKVTIKVTSNPGTIMSETRFTYDSDIIEVTDVTEHDMFRTAEMGDMSSDYLAPNMAKNPIQLINGFQAYIGNSTNTGSLYTLELKIKDNAAFGESEISFDGAFYDHEMNDFPVKCEKAAVTVVCGHEDVTEEVEKAPTCTENGINSIVCNICGEKTGTADIQAEGHSFGEWEQSEAAGCTEAGMDRRECGICGAEETRDVAALGHNVETWTVTKEPTYTEEGLKEGECTRCRETLTQVIFRLSETEIVKCDDMFKGYSINVSTKIFDKNNNELSDNKLQLKALELKDTASAKISISELLDKDEEIKALSVFEIKLITDTEKTEVGSLDRPLNVTLKVPADYVMYGKVYVLGADGTWTKAGVEIEDGTISFDMTGTQTYAFANIGVIEDNNTDNPNGSGENKNPEENRDNNTDNPGSSNNGSNSNNSEENKNNIGNNTGNSADNNAGSNTAGTKTDSNAGKPVKTGDSSAVWGIIGIMALSGLAAVISKKKAHE